MPYDTKEILSLFSLSSITPSYNSFFYFLFILFEYLFLKCNISLAPGTGQQAHGLSPRFHVASPVLKRAPHHDPP
jgi:hypothetical protein